MVSERRRWPARVAGVLGTAALLGTGVAIAVMVLPSPKEEAVVPSAPAATPTPEAEPKKTRPLTRAERRARAQAVAVLTQQGFDPVRLRDYRPRSELRVLIGLPATDDAGPRRAFFFAGRRFVGHDSGTPSASLRVVRAGDRSVTLRYGLYQPGDRRCCPRAGHARVRFRWDGGALLPLDDVPPPFERVPPA
jgi:hypothetical protein